MNRTASIFFTVSLFAATAIFLQSCKHQPDPYAHIDGSGRTICFETEVLPLFQSNCAMSGCHGNGSHEEGVTLDSYSGIVQGDNIVPGKLHSSEAFESMIGNSEEMMPPPPRTAMSEAQLTIIATWIMQGAENTTGCGDNCDTALYTFSGAIQPMIQQYCLGCHNSTSTGGGINLSTYSGVYTQAMNGKLYGSVAHSSGFVAMPQNAAQLSECRLTQISKWINEGAPNN